MQGHITQDSTHLVVFQTVYSTILCTKCLGGGSLHSLTPLHRHPGVSLGQMISELLE